ncbi:metallophosphoesterase family protein [Bacillus sp. N9]
MRSDFMLKIAVVGDMHFPNKDGMDESVLKIRNEFYQEFVHCFMEKEADLYVSVGDLVDGGTKEEYDEIEQLIKPYHKPFYHVFGNHDVLKFSRKELHTYFDGRHGDQVINKDQAMIVF